MIQNNPKVKSFCEKYYIKVLNENKRCMKHLPPISIANNQNGLSVTEISYDTEPVITLEIPLSKLEAITDLETMFYRNIDNDSARHLFESWMKQQSDEKQLRKKYTACQKAYEEYNAVLDWCRQNPKQIKDL